MRDFTGRIGAGLKDLFESLWRYTGGLGAVCLFAAVLGLGIYHAVVRDAKPPMVRCFAGVVNPAGAEPPRGLVPLGQVAAPGVAHVRLEYGPEHRMTRMRHLDAAGQLCPLPGSAVAEQQLQYDTKGQLRCRRNFDALGNPAEDAQGVATREFEYDAAGRLVRTWFLDARGKLTSPRFPGYAESRLSYDAQGRPASVEYLDAAGQPVLNAVGEQRVVYSYGADGSMTRVNQVGGLPADNHAGIARETVQQLPGGTRRSWHNAAGEAVQGAASGAAMVLHEQHPAQHVQRLSYKDAAGQPAAFQRACAEQLQRTNARGNPEWECFSGADGLPVNHPVLGYAERVCEYSPQGELQREFFWDAEGNPAPVCERRFIGDYGLSLHRDGSTAVQPLP